MRRSALLLTLVAAFTLSGCAQATIPSVTPPPEPSSTPLPAVSLQTTCMLLFGSDVDGPVSQATDIVTRYLDSSSLSSVSEQELTATIDELETAGRNADTSIKPYIEAHANPLRELLKAKRGSDATMNMSDFKAASLELLNKCRRYM